MTLSIVTAITLSSTTATDDTEKFSNTEHRNYPADCLMQFDGSIWQNVGETIYVPSYNSTVTYSLGDLVFKDGYIQKVVDFQTQRIPKMPSQYANVDTDTNSNNWTHRYFKIADTYTDGFDYTTTSGYHHVFDDERDDGGKIFHTVTPPSGSGGTQYQSKNYYTLSNDTVESIADRPAYGQDNEAEGYAFQTFISDGDALYARTHIDAPIEYTDATGGDPVFAIVGSIDELGDFVRIRPNNVYAALDDRHYTASTGTGSLQYIVNVEGGVKFDTLSLGRVLCDTVDVYFYDDLDGTGTLVDSTTGYVVDNSRDTGGNLPDYPTTAILYSDTVVSGGGSIKVIMNGNVISVGSILAGLKVNAGFTNLQFSNSFIDHSPKNVDNWGNVEYIEGVKVRTFNCTVDILTEHYDMTDRLLVSIGGSTVIVNGSDSTDNTQPDSTSVFASTMLVGRLSNVQLKSVVKGKRLDSICKYSFNLTELT